MPVEARRLIRKMRGGAQAHLIECGDGHCYVVKFRNNPQHRRILINEFVGNTLLEFLEVATPPVAVVSIGAEFLQAHPEAGIHLGNRRIEVERGWHFGSRFPGDPATLAVYDYLPDALLAKVANLSDFRAALVFDKWTANADARQAIFFRARLKGAGGRTAFAAQMMDNGYLFDGPNWEFRDAPAQGVYFRPCVYTGVRGLADLEPWLSRVEHFPEEVLDRALKRIPGEWVEQDRELLERLLERLLTRGRRVRDLVESARQVKGEQFPDWR